MNPHALTAVILAVPLLALSGCSTTPDIVLRNRDGVTARCEGFFVASGWGRSRLLARQQRECVEDFQRAGYERVPEEKSK